MRNIVQVFYQGELIQESTGWISSKNLPDGAFVHDTRRGITNRWYRVSRAAGGIPINLSDVPKELLALQLILP